MEALALIVVAAHAFYSERDGDTIMVDLCQDIMVTYSDFIEIAYHRHMQIVDIGELDKLYNFTG